GRTCQPLRLLTRSRPGGRITVGSPVSAASAATFWPDAAFVRNATKFCEVTEQNDSCCGSRSAAKGPGERSSWAWRSARRCADRRGSRASEGDGYSGVITTYREIS